jgi:polypeptide N-acetylgalactosaminyltransferase
MSLLHYTPARYIAEIMFVSDGNAQETLFADKIRSLSPLITMLVLPSHGVGLISAKMRAVAAVAPEASVLVFLEPHIRLNRQWLEPLLVRIRKYPQVLAMPTIDAIPQDDFKAYLASGYGQWRFEWNLNLIYNNPAQKLEVPSEPWPSPATSGGIFAIGKDWWNKLGFYDNGMVGWGGDHVEATMKVWRCGGHIDIIPCSRIGHLFREPSRRPYDVQVDQVVRNYARMAHVWFDEHIDKFFKMKPEARGMDVGDLTQAKKLRESLQCKNMSWYLKYVDHEMRWESDKICIPGCDRKQNEICCLGNGADRRSTIDFTIPREKFKPVNLDSILKQHRKTIAASSASNATEKHQEL